MIALKQDSAHLARRCYRAAQAPDLDTFDDLMFAALRVIVATVCRKSDKGLTYTDFKSFFDLAPAGFNPVTFDEVTDALIARLSK